MKITCDGLTRTSCGKSTRTRWGRSGITPKTRSSSCSLNQLRHRDRSLRSPMMVITLLNRSKRSNISINWPWGNLQFIIEFQYFLNAEIKQTLDFTGKILKLRGKNSSKLWNWTNFWFTRKIESEGEKLVKTQRVKTLKINKPLIF